MKGMAPAFRTCTYRNVPHTSTGHSPAELIFGKIPIKPCDGDSTKHDKGWGSHVPFPAGLE